MKKLVDGYRRYRTEVFPQNRELHAAIARKQSPRYMFISCADSRVLPHDFTSTGADDMFMERSLGNIVPEPGSDRIETPSTIEYAVQVLEVAHLIVCGHSGCGAMKALLNPESVAGLPAVAAWLSGAARTREIVDRKYPHLTGDALLDMTVRENVLVQLDHVRSQPSVAPRVQDGSLQLHGWVYEIEHGRVIAYDSRIDAFVPLTQAYPAGRSWV